jgi:hypothetical protein
MGHQHTRGVSRPAEHVDGLTDLVYELLDAHTDTEKLANGPTTGLLWRIHLHYLRDLQRTGREILARAVSQ